MGLSLPGQRVGPKYIEVNLTRSKEGEPTCATKDSLMREVTMVLFPTPSSKAGYQRPTLFLSPQQTAHHPRLEECGHPVAFPKIVVKIQ